MTQQERVDLFNRLYEAAKQATGYEIVIDMQSEKLGPVFQFRPFMKLESVAGWTPPMSDDSAEPPKNDAEKPLPEDGNKADS